MVPQRNIFRDGADYGVPLAARLSDSMPSVCSFEMPPVGKAALDLTGGSAQEAS